MNEQTTQYNEPVKSSQNPWIIVVSIVITALVVGGVVYALQSSHLKSSEQSFQQQITLLQNQIDQLQQPQQNQNQQAMQPSTSQNQNNQPVVDPNKNDNQVNQPQEIVYSNSQYGFSLTFPQTWKGYTAQNRTLNWGSYGTSDSVDFGFSVQDSLFNVSIHTKSQWQQIKSEEGPTPTYLGENSQYVFGFATAQDAANDTIIARMKEIQNIVKTFRVTK
jgi:type II secretory pathway pseudopilin PulG